MRNKNLAPVVALGSSLLLLAVFLNNPAVADAPIEGSHFAYEGMKNGDHGNYGHTGGQWGAHGHKRGGDGMRQHGFDPFKKILRYKSKLNLTSQQTGEITNLQMEFKKQKIRNTADREIARLDFHRLLAAETLDEALLQGSAKGISDTVSKQISAAMDARIAVAKILTAEQRKKMAELDCDQ